MKDTYISPAVTTAGNVVTETLVKSTNAPENPILQKRPSAGAVGFNL